MADKIEGTLELNILENGDVVLNLDKERNGIGHLVFSPNQARAFARKLLKKADEGDMFKKRSIPVVVF